MAIKKRVRGGTADFSKIDLSMRKKEKPALSRNTPVERPRRPIRGTDMRARKPGGEKNHQFYPGGSKDFDERTGKYRSKELEARKRFGGFKGRKPTIKKPSPGSTVEQVARYKKDLERERASRKDNDETRARKRPTIEQMKKKISGTKFKRKGPSARGLERGKRLGTLRKKVGSQYQTGGRPKSKLSTAQRAKLRKKTKLMKMRRYKGKSKQYWASKK